MSSGHTSRAAGTKTHPPGSGEAHEPEPVPGETTRSGEQRERFGSGREAQAEAGRKGGALSADRPAEARRESARKAARTRAERYGDHLYKSDPKQDDLQDFPTTRAEGKQAKGEPVGGGEEEGGERAGRRDEEEEEDEDEE